MSVRSEHYLSLPGDLHIGITSDRELFLGESEELLLGAYLPDVQLLDAAPSNLDMMLHHVESPAVHLVAGRSEIEIHDSWKESFPDDLPHLLYSVARSLWLRRGYFPTHAACVGDDVYTLMPGHSGVGKTTVALEAITRHDQKLLSGNTTLIQCSEAGDLRAIAGTRSMTLKTEDFKRGEYDSLRSMEYGNRTAFELPIDMQAAGPKTIGRVALVRLSDGFNAWRQLPPLSALHTLYPYFLDTEYADCLVGQGNALYIGDTPSAAREQLAAQLRRAVVDLTVSTGTGSAEFLAEKVSGL
ncbi:MAG TPA: hypothetical protein VLF91_00735 [Candidatus Saccharimonadales bacterium]|nr:hypothetical protein [Candidatus Saccharimonadales bacterium]